jgi:flavin reductase (DIM6/NTAB) family NADH-FMN oxidoreductase RutF
MPQKTAITPLERNHTADGHADATAFKQAMRQLASGVSVVTVGLGEGRSGFTATSIISFAVEPPTLLVSVDRRSSSWAILETNPIFAVNFLAEGQEAIADRFAGRGGAQGAERYAGATWRAGKSGALLLEGASAHIECLIEDIIERHTHAILLAKVLDAEAFPERRPLLHWQGRFGVLGD